MSEFVELRPHNINSKTIVEIVQVLRNGGLAIIPTDSIYAIVGDLLHRDVMEKICRLLEKKPSHANLSILCKDLSSLSEYTSPISNPTYKVMNRLLPGPFTFILKASNNVPKIFRQNKKTIDPLCLIMFENVGLCFTFPPKSACRGTCPTQLCFL